MTWLLNKRDFFVAFVQKKYFKKLGEAFSTFIYIDKMSILCVCVTEISSSPPLVKRKAAGPNLYFFLNLSGVFSAWIILIVILMMLVVSICLSVIDHQGTIGIVVVEVVVVLDQIVAEVGADLKISILGMGDFWN